VLSSGFRALLIKEFLQLLRNKQLLVILVITPMIQLSAYGFALDPEVKNLRLGVIDLACSPASRDLIATFVSNQVFNLVDSGRTEQELSLRVRDGQVDAGLVIGPDFTRRIKAGKRASIQVLLDGVDANTAGIAAAYVQQTLANFKSEHAQASAVRDLVETDATFVYNPGLIASWFFVPGVIGMVLNIAGILVSSATLLREKETGTLEQLLMTPVSSAEILIAKIIPLMVVLFVNIGVSLTIGMGIFHLPFRGDPISMLLISLLYIFVVMSIGITLATISSNQRQAMLISFFITMPVIQLSGALAPLESMPPFFLTMSVFNPLRYYIVCLKGVLLKGVGLEYLYPHVIVLFCFAFILLTLSAWRFRKQMA
jgi:ABC-2 type transport system permease protein